MKKILFTITALATLALSANAQSSYNRAIGLRFGNSYFDGVQASYKQFISNAGALEFNAGIAPNPNWLGLSVAGAYQHHFPIGNIPGFNWYIGGGLGISHIIADGYYTTYSGTMVGIFATGGVDYKFKNIPLNLSADYRPTINIIRPKDSYWGSGSYNNFNISVRYTF